MLNLNDQEMEKKDLRPGDILLFPPNEWIGKAIVAITKGSISHVAIYNGDQDGKASIAHSHLEGAAYMLFDLFLKDAGRCYVRRHEKQSDLSPVLQAAGKYIQAKNHYPFANIFLLGMLLVSKRFSKNILHSKIFYNFLLNVTHKILPKLDTHPELGKGKHGMSCSQFVTQCFSDAGKDYAIKFKAILCQYESVSPESDEMSLLEFIRQQNKSNLIPANLPPLPEMKITQEEEDKIIADFIALLESTGKLGLIDNIAKSDDKELINIAATLIGAISNANSESDLEGFLNTGSGPNMNYLITPDDLLSNTENLLDMGVITK